jgi:arsenate reductase
MPTKKRVLFLCTGNSCRSQMAEGLMNHMAGDRFEAFSAGANPAESVHPIAIRVLKEIGIEISDRTPKPLNAYMHEPFDFVITVCDNAKEACPVLPGHRINAHWGFEDPAKFEGSDEAKYHFFSTTLMEIEYRIRLFIELNEGFHAAVHHIGTLKKGDVPSYSFA